MSFLVAQRCHKEVCTTRIDAIDDLIPAHLRGGAELRIDPFHTIDTAGLVVQRTRGFPGNTFCTSEQNYPQRICDAMFGFESVKHIGPRNPSSDRKAHEPCDPNNRRTVRCG